VLNGEDRHQHQVDDERLRRRSCRSAIDGLWHDEIFNKADGVEESDEKYAIGHDAIEEPDDPSDDIALSLRIRILNNLGHNLLRSAKSRQKSMTGTAAKNLVRPLIFP
jgi:hypothetical protein